MLLGIICLVIAAAVVLLLLGLFSPKISAKRLPLPEAKDQAEKKTLLGSASRALPFTKKLLEKLKLVEGLKRKLDAAHIKLSPQAFFNIKLFLIALLAGLAYLLLRRLEPIALAAPLILGYILPDIWLHRRILQRKAKIVLVLPETVDLLGLCVEAGLDFTAALNWIVTKVTPANAMVDELALLLEEISWGKGRSQALKDMSKRLNIPEVNSFVQSLIQAERMGTSVSEAFRIISEDTRGMRFQRGQRLAIKAPMKILIPLVFCILPVIAIIVAGPILLQFMQGNLLQNFTK